MGQEVAKLGADVSLEEALARPNGLFSHLRCNATQRNAAQVWRTHNPQPNRPCGPAHRHFCSADIEPQGFPPEFSMLEYIFGQSNLASHILFHLVPQCVCVCVCGGACALV